MHASGQGKLLKGRCGYSTSITDEKGLIEAVCYWVTPALYKPTDVLAYFLRKEFDLGEPRAAATRHSLDKVQGTDPTRTVYALTVHVESIVEDTRGLVAVHSVHRCDRKYFLPGDEGRGRLSTNGEPNFPCCWYCFSFSWVAPVYNSV